MPLALTVAVLTYLLLRRAFGTGIRARYQGLGAALLNAGSGRPPLRSGALGRVNEWLEGARWGVLCTGRAGGIAGVAAMVRDAVRKLVLSCYSRRTAQAPCVTTKSANFCWNLHSQ